MVFCVINCYCVILLWVYLFGVYFLKIMIFFDVIINNSYVNGFVGGLDLL